MFNNASGMVFFSVFYMELELVEIMGYLASLGVLVSFTMKNVQKLRVINTIGCLLFVIYGFMMPSLRVGLPIIITNAAIIAINGYYLLQSNNKG